ncbi:MAG: DUF1830 domain-containing protein [Cyanobacteria bacterium SID2]|nr:DUF1830 domain-containing protein [Cyanobacteria bacterium SID2]MBP0005402.1 DUF1830 domain-containing protein [Cyanobacteria bacterium SBC]
MQSIRLTDGLTCYVDRLVFPGDRWLFEVEANLRNRPQTYLEVRDLYDGRETVVQSIPCHHLTGVL